MTSTRGIALSCLFLMSAASAATATEPCDAPATTILVVRHADRAGQADSLSAAGVARADDLARVALTASVRAIYHSDARTVTPPRRLRALDISCQYPPKKSPR
jgi:hypothetical protein